jgi:hypothetical protein
VVDDQRVPTRCEQLRESDLAAIQCGFEYVVICEQAAGGERPTLGGDLFVQPPKRIPASNSSLRASRYSLVSPANLMFGSRSLARHSVISRAFPWAS